VIHCPRKVHAPTHPPYTHPLRLFRLLYPLHACVCTMRIVQVLPIRYAQRVEELYSLPYGLSKKKQVIEVCVSTWTLCSF
jgi:hypothetical protein